MPCTLGGSRLYQRWSRAPGLFFRKGSRIVPPICPELVSHALYSLSFIVFGRIVIVVSRAGKFFQPRLYRPRGLHGAIVARMVPSTFSFFGGTIQGAHKGKHQGRQNPVSPSTNSPPPWQLTPVAGVTGNNSVEILFVFIRLLDFSYKIVQII